MINEGVLENPHVDGAFGLHLWNHLPVGKVGVVAGPILGLYQGMDSDTLIIALIVVVVGGLGTLTGAFWGGLLIGLADTFGKVLIPEFALFLTFAVMALVLLLRPSGLFGRKLA